MARRGQKASRLQERRKPWHLSVTSSGFSEKNLKRQQTLSWKPVDEKTYAFLLSTLEEAEMKLFSENSDFTSDNETEAVQTLTQLKKQCKKKLKSAHCPEPKWQSVDMQNCVEWLEKMKAKNKLLQKAHDEEERELEELEDEIQDMGE